MQPISLFHQSLLRFLNGHQCVYILLILAVDLFECLTSFIEAMLEQLALAKQVDPITLIWKLGK
ncbi:hypothetical protein D3C77_779360 [compost metagenome]